MLDRVMLSMPPAPKLEMALDMPTELKHTKPTRKTCVHGELSGVSSVRVQELTAVLANLEARESICDGCHLAVEADV